MMKKIIAAAMMTASLGAISLPAAANVVVHVAPPAPREEAAPPPRHGYVWVPGHWDSRGHGYHWVKGSWVHERHGYTYVVPTWVERDGGWHKEGGKWSAVKHDHDGDGIPDRHDDHPNNPNRG